jgi:hypothetical protein
MRALGRKNLPETIFLNGVTWRHQRTHKHDFWAATGFYKDDRGERAVLKMGRIEPYCGMSLAWVGRWLCRREMRFYNALSDLPNVPRILGRVGETGFLHEYVPGEPLSRERPVPDGFFIKLEQLIRELHRRRIAYVDANKPENILLGADGLPHLIDFQISWDLTELGDNFINRWILTRHQRADIYHLLKHKRRMRPDEMTEAERVRAQHRNVSVKVLRAVSMPYKKIRRSTFKRLRESGRLLPEGSK